MPATAFPLEHCCLGSRDKAQRPCPGLGQCLPSRSPPQPREVGWPADSPHQRREVLSPDCFLSGPPHAWPPPLSSLTRWWEASVKPRYSLKHPQGGQPSAAGVPGTIDSPVALQPHLLSAGLLAAEPAGSWGMGACLKTPADHPGLGYPTVN